MSKNSMEKVTCPKCKHVGEAIIYSSINATTQPELRDDVLNSTAFKWQCANCDEEILITYPCLYHDMEHEFMVWLIPNGEIPHTMDDILSSYAAGYEFRVVSSHMELIEKINIFERSLCDRAVEVSKTAILSQYGRTHDRQMPKAIIFHGMNDIGEFVYLIVDQNDTTHTSVIGSQLYVEIFKDMKAKKFPREMGFLKIDANWAREMIGKL